MEGWWRLVPVGLDVVAPSRMIGVSASVSHPLQHKVQKFYSGTGSPGRSRKNSSKTVVVWYVKLNPHPLFSVTSLILYHKTNTKYLIILHSELKNTKTKLYLHTQESYACVLWFNAMTMNIRNLSLNLAPAVNKRLHRNKHTADLPTLLNTKS